MTPTAIAADLAEQVDRLVAETDVLTRCFFCQAAPVQLACEFGFSVCPWRNGGLGLLSPDAKEDKTN